MKTKLNTQINDNPVGRAAIEIVQIIARSGHEAWFVGGGVRDLILERNPGDFDIATSARPDALHGLFPESQMVGAKFGVLLVRHNGHSIEVATFREEGEYHDKRRPELIRFSDMQRDALRRDFTVNALYYNPEAGDLVDLVGGLPDLEHRVLRTVGNPVSRFNEDVLRVIRGVRFAANLKFEIEAETWTALIDAAPMLTEISMERIRDELIKGFTGGDPSRFLHLLDESGILNLLIPEMLALKGCAQPEQFHPEGDVYKHTDLLLKNLKSNPSPELAFAVLLHDIGKPATQTFEDRIRFNGHDKLGAEMAESIGRRLRLPNCMIDEIGSMVRRHMQFVNVPSMKDSTLNRFLAAPTIDDELELHRVDCLASHGNLDTYNYSVNRLKEFRENESFKGKLPQPLVNGHDLICLGMKPGPVFSDILQSVFDDQLDGIVRSKEEGLEAARQLYQRLSPATNA